MTRPSVPMMPPFPPSTKRWIRQHFAPHFVAHFVLARRLFDKVEDKVTDKVARSRSKTPILPKTAPVWTAWSLLVASLGISLSITNAQTLSDVASETKAVDLWSFNIVPYLWLAGYDGTIGPTGLPTVPQIRSTSTDPFATHVSAGAMLFAKVRYRDVGLMFDGAWVRLTTEGTSDSTHSGTEMKTDFAYTTMALSYRLPAFGKLDSDVFAGARIWYIANELDFHSGSAPGFTSSSSRTWTDPVLGAQLRYDLTRHWFGTMLGDVGGFGVGSDISWSVFGGVGYQFTDWFSATVGYRYMHVDYDKDQFLMNVNVQGFLLGIGFRF